MIFKKNIFHLKSMTIKKSLYYLITVMIDCSRRLWTKLGVIQSSKDMGFKRFKKTKDKNRNQINNWSEN
jgi:hypothetical protein